MSDKIRIAFVKFGGMSAGGTEKYLQQIAANLPPNRFAVDFYYCDSAPYIGSDYKHGDTDQNRLEYMQSSCVNLIKFNVRYKDVTTPTHEWIDTDFWEKFDENNYDIVQTGRSGHPECPFDKMKNVSIVDSIHLPGMVDNQRNIKKVIHVSEWNRQLWVNQGGDDSRSTVIYLPIEPSKVSKEENLRSSLGLEGKFVVGMHQRDDENIFSDWPIGAFSELPGDDNIFLLLGGSALHKKQAEDLGIKNFIHLPFNSDMDYVYRFLNTLDVYVHGRKDGEINSQSIAEALCAGLPIVSHYGILANGHIETVGDAGNVNGFYDSYLFDIINYKENKDLRLWLGEKAKKRFSEKYSFSKNMEKIIEIYEDIFNNKSVISSDLPWIEEWLNSK